MKYYDIIPIDKIIYLKECHPNKEIVEALIEDIENERYQWVFKPVEIVRYKKGIKMRTNNPPFDYYLEINSHSRFCICKAIGLTAIRCHINTLLRNDGPDRGNPFPRKWRPNLGGKKKIKNKTAKFSPYSVDLSIVVAVKDRGGIRAMNFFRSLATQTDKNFELIVIDYGSKNRDEFKKFSETYGFIHYYVKKVGWNRAKALNIGIGISHGIYIMTTDIDIIFKSDFIEKLKNILSQNRFVWTRPQSKTVTCLKKFPDEFHTVMKKSWIPKGRTFGSIQCAMRSWFVEINGYDERMMGYGPIDYDMITRAKMAGLELYRFKSSECIHQTHDKSPYSRRTSRVARERYWRMAGDSVVKTGQRIKVKPSCSSKDFSIVLLVSRSGKTLQRCLRSIKSQRANEIRAYIDPIRLTGKMRNDAMRQLKAIGAKILYQSITSDSNEVCDKMEREKAMETLRRKRKYRRELQVLAKRFKRHHSGHIDVIRNVHRGIMEAENKWVARIDDDDEWREDIHKLINKYADNNVGIIYGDVQVSDGELRKSERISKPNEASKCRGSALIINRDAFRKIHSNIDHFIWWDFKIVYWLVRGGFRPIYVPKVISVVHLNTTPDPRRILQYGRWRKILNQMNKQDLVIK